MKKNLTAVVAIVAAMMVAVPGAALAEYKIGAIFATTGGASMLGLPEKNTAEMLVDDLNAKGGINGEKVKLFL
jgi:branched-chain amino acid transport system substrate-binding protein